MLLLAVVIFGTATAQETKSVKIVDGPYLQAVGENEFTVVWTSGCWASLDEPPPWRNWQKRCICPRRKQRW